MEQKNQQTFYKARDFLLSINMKQTILHLTENYQLKAADALISKLRQELGASNAYIDELTDNIKKLEEENNSLKIQLALKDKSIKEINDKYSRDVNEYLKTDVLYQKYIKVINSVTQNIIRIKEHNDKLVREIMKLRDERNNKEVG